MGISIIADLHSKHLELWSRSLADPPSDTLAVDARELLARLRSAGQVVDDPLERQRLESYASYWGRFLFRATGEYPDTNLATCDQPSEADILQEIEPIAPAETVIGIHSIIQSGKSFPRFVLQQRIPLQKPPRPDHFTGREEEVGWLLAELQPGRRVTLCGPGGIGKTALASEAIWRLAPGDEPPDRFPDGILYHTFYHQPQTDLALVAIARAYGEEPHPNTAEAARRALAGRRALLVLDGAEAADNLDAVLAVSGSCGVLITTRQHADAPASWLDISPLPQDEAVQLLQAWGGNWTDDVAAARRIADLLGGLPLALFLAGRYMAANGQYAGDYLAWLESTPQAALHFGERPSRSLPLLMARSLEQVSAVARTALGVAGLLALAPFDGQVVAAALGESETVAERALGELMNCGLLVRSADKVSGGQWQVTHALAHTHARQELAPAAEVVARLAEYFDTFAREQRELGPLGYRMLDRQRGHILAIQTTCAAAGQWEAAISITWAAVSYLDLQGHWMERLALLQTGLAAAHAAHARYDEGTFCGLLGRAHADLGEVRSAIGYYEQALAISQEISDRLGEGTWLASLGGAYHSLGEVRRAVEYYERALAIIQEISDERGEGNHLSNLGLAYADLGEVRRAIEYYEQALAISREIGDRRGEGADLSNLGLAYADLGEVRRAIEFHDQALAISREIGDRRGEGNHLGNLGLAYAALREVRRAIEFYDQALAISREIGDRRNEGAWLSSIGIAYRNLGQVQQAIVYYEEALTITREIGDLRGEGTILSNLGVAYQDQGQMQRAIEFFEQALIISREIGDRRGEASQLANLGLAGADLGDKRTRELWEEALRVFEEIESPDAATVRGWLAKLDQTTNSAPEETQP